METDHLTLETVVEEEEDAITTTTAGTIPLASTVTTEAGATSNKEAAIPQIRDKHGTTATTTISHVETIGIDRIEVQ